MCIPRRTQRNNRKLFIFVLFFCFVSIFSAANPPTSQPEAATTTVTEYENDVHKLKAYDTIDDEMIAIYKTASSKLLG